MFWLNCAAAAVKHSAISFRKQFCGKWSKKERLLPGSHGAKWGTERRMRPKKVVRRKEETGGGRVWVQNRTTKQGITLDEVEQHPHLKLF